jgi:hypothetical protein
LLLFKVDPSMVFRRSLVYEKNPGELFESVNKHLLRTGETYSYCVR